MRPDHVPVLDRDAYDKLRTVLGSDRMGAILDDLDQQVRDAFADADLSAQDRDLLAHQAHAMIAAAGLLGFLELSQACLAVQAACKHDEALDDALGWVRSARLSTLNELGRLRENEPPGSADHSG